MPLQVAVPLETVHVSALKEKELPVMLQVGAAVAANEAEKAYVAAVEFTLTEPKSCDREADASEDARAHSKAARSRVEQL